MSDHSDDRPQLTPLVIGLTRPPMMWGVPLSAFYLILGITLIAFLVTSSFWAAAIAPVTYLALFALCSRDVRILDLVQTAGRRTPRTPNRTFWQTNSYGP
ncbi:VirB3 family type IV secretion system protein [Mesorhizobium sp. CO1-1-7]|uniref:type IV secretion system protein VirB3 n=1 Tax=unclassified Mesorhizobium TaxID=325217 RepID=UPI001127D505|nr:MULTISPECIES: VirB3 family type IV secretion system protein [unclassified Mesorhizobium]MBZ9931822.1 VirB3 family type IV secretion system protein [Mesorhizobium sp. BR1-1-5]MBZ9747661.1 VirB3 family type IV secretion system protein [Mesorhizobium sp. CO1-1-7]MBZ9905630.1 VirB3 family type IV secretion system protein [Mesorhizobium sp. BR115XR7A]TPK73879.1 type IV secretion system protein VirB3 [Mesorhizobium sp. B2-4-18]TPL74101.1 type IV secretion system protein VirB3 [Mesorhizobium sp. B